MDTKRFMIIDTSRRGTPGMFITSRVAAIDAADGLWRITFYTSPVTYTYRYERIKFFTKAERIDVVKHGFYLRNRHVGNILELYRFGDDHHYYHAVFDGGKELDFDEKDVYVSRTNIDECGGDTWKYLNHLADETGIEVKGFGNVVKWQYGMVDRQRDNVPLFQFVGGRKNLSEYSGPKQVLYPFGCNASQMQGVENALKHQVSIIQGPPGTGKTQTILNIIANLLVEGKSVLIVSNNNSAVENVAEKLADKDVGLGFLVAQLGNKDNRELFVASQHAFPDMDGWQLPKEKETASEIKNTIVNVSHGFERQTMLAKLNVELAALKTESRYDELRRTPAPPFFGWMGKIPSRRLMALKLECDVLAEKDRNPGWLSCVRWMRFIGLKSWRLLNYKAYEISRSIESAYYTSRMNEIKAKIADCEKYLTTIDMDASMKVLRDLSMKMLRHKIAADRKGRHRASFSLNDIKPRTEEFLKEYPVVLSTVISSKNCISKDMVFDYVIMDEASQVDITTGALALSCAMNAVIVGDDKQLPNVIDNKTKLLLEDIEKRYHVEDKYRSSTHSFLQSCCEVFSDVPQTLLREHYRCHPKIIEFCNRMFYGGQLVAMTRDRGEENVLTAVLTVKGQHARGHYNQREIDVIRTEVLPSFDSGSSVGIITPYREQVEAINKQVKPDVASTVHKYQGRECDNIVMSMVDNETSVFSDDPNLLNVAISRAKSRLVVVTNGNDIKSDTNLGKLIAYIRYNNFEVTDSRIHSIFDSLYRQYTEERLAFEASRSRNKGELSENLICRALRKCIFRLGLANIKIVGHYPLSRLFADYSLLDDEEKRFVNDARSHVDFLLYDGLTMQPLLCIEVDGWKYHQTDVQKKRDRMKDAILDKYRLRLIRLSTIQVVTEDSLCQIILSNIS